MNPAGAEVCRIEAAEGAVREIKQEFEGSGIVPIPGDRNFQPYFILR